MFDAPFLLQIRGENVLYFNVKDKGIVTVTGCGHPGIINLLNFARDTFKENRLYGCYGGLHLSIFGAARRDLDPACRAALEPLHAANALQPLERLLQATWQRALAARPGDPNA